MNNTQFDALVRLMYLKPESRTCKATRAVFVDGLSSKNAALKHGLNISTVTESCKNVRAAIKNCYTVITGEDAE